MKTVLFTNFTNEDFTGYWNGKGKTIKAGESLYMPEYLGEHFAKHLVNRELLSVDEHGNYKYPNGDKFTSPKIPDQVLPFMELFNKACKEVDIEKEEKGQRDFVEIDVLNKNKKKIDKPKKEEEFKDKPKEE